MAREAGRLVAAPLALARPARATPGLHRLGSARLPLRRGVRERHVPRRRDPRLRGRPAAAPRPTAMDASSTSTPTTRATAPAGGAGRSAILVHGPNGMFCHGFVPMNPYAGDYIHPPNTPNRKRGPSKGDTYRITVTSGPAPPPTCYGRGLGSTSSTRATRPTCRLERQMNAKLDALRAGASKCSAH